jgi:SAM-dependent methyltransferase
MGEQVDERSDFGDRPRTHEDFNHLRRYEWAVPKVAGMRVLDVASGSGYGTRLLSQQSDVVGLEVDEGQASRSRSRGLDVRTASVPPFDLPDGSFDAVVSFETIEHVDDDSGFVSEIRRVLKPGGLLLLSTPNKALSSPDGPPSNPYHVREYHLADLEALLSSFQRVKVFSQAVLPPKSHRRVNAYRVLARFPALCRPERWWDRPAHGDAKIRPLKPGDSPKYFVLEAVRP